MRESSVTSCAQRDTTSDNGQISGRSSCGLPETAPAAATACGRQHTWFASVDHGPASHRPAIVRCAAGCAADSGQRQAERVQAQRDSGGSSATGRSDGNLRQRVLPESAAAVAASRQFDHSGRRDRSTTFRKYAAAQCSALLSTTAHCIDHGCGGHGRLRSTR